MSSGLNKPFIFLFLTNLDKLFAIFGMFFSFVFVIFGLCFNKPLSTLIGIFFFISCILWLSMRETDHFITNLPSSKFQVKVWTIFYFIFYTFSILIFYMRSNLYERPIFYFILFAFMAAVVACQIIISDRNDSGLILFQIILLGMNITWTQILITPGLVGIDPWYHSALTNHIITDGILPFGYSYSKLPIFHIIITIVSIISTFSYKFAALVSVSFGQIACNALFIFLIGNYLFKNHRIGLLAALLVIIADLHILMSYWSIPNAFGAIFITIILFLVLIKLQCLKKFETSIIIILMMALIIFTHAIIGICMAIFLFVAWGMFAFYQYFFTHADNNISLLIPIGFIVAMFAWWSYITSNLGELARFISYDFSLARGENLYQTSTLPYFETIFAYIGTYLFLTFSIIGIFYMISRKGNRSTFTLAILACIPLCISFIAYVTNSEIIGYRWHYISEILMSIPLALALIIVSGKKLKKPFLHYLFMFLFIVSLSFFSVMDYYGNNDNHFLIPNKGISNFYTEAEMVGSNFFAEKSTGMILSDINYAYNPSSSLFEHFYGINRDRLAVLDFEMQSGKLPYEDSIKILRLRYLSDYQRIVGQSFNNKPCIYTILFSKNYNKIYENPSIVGYI